MSYPKDCLFHFKFAALNHTYSSQWYIKIIYCVFISYIRFLCLVSSLGVLGKHDWFSNKTIERERLSHLGVIFYILLQLDKKNKVKDDKIRVI